MLNRVAFGYSASVATSRPMVASSCLECWQFGILHWHALMHVPHQECALHKLSFGCLDFVCTGFVPGQCPLSLAGSTQTGSFGRGKRTQAFGGHCIIAAAKRQRCQIQISSSICFGGQCISQCRRTGMDRSCLVRQRVR